MRTVVGTMTGTSMDGVDAVAVAIDGHGLEMQASFIDIASVSFDDIRDDLQALHASEQDSCSKFALIIGDRTRQAIDALQLPQIDLIALHGQTIYHKPPTSIQLINPAPVVEAFDCTVLDQPRQMDLMLGGEGAPITPLADWVMFRAQEHDVAIVNLGGFCNVTMLPAQCTPQDIQGFDVCCCNLLLNSIAQERTGKSFDNNGELASQGKVIESLHEAITRMLSTQHHDKQSLGHADDLGQLVSNWEDVPSADLAATACAAIGTCITHATRDADAIYLAGGGCQNQQLASHIKHSGTVADLGVPIQAREGMAVAILGAMHMDNISITLEQVTGRRESENVVGFTQASP